MSQKFATIFFTRLYILDFLNKKQQISVTSELLPISSYVTDIYYLFLFELFLIITMYQVTDIYYYFKLLQIFVTFRGLFGGGPGGPWPPQNFLFFFCQENFMKNLLGKFHAESMPVLGLAQYCLAVLGLAQYQWPRQWGGQGGHGPPKILGFTK